MRDRIARWFPLTLYSEPLIRSRARSTYIVGVLILAFATLFYITVTVAALGAGRLTGNGVIGIVLGVGALDGMAFTAIMLTRSGQQALGGTLLLTAWAIPILLGLGSVGYPADGLGWLIMLSVWVGISLTVLLTGTRLIIPIMILSMLAVIIFSIRVQPPPSVLQPPNFVFAQSVLLFISLAAQLGINWLLARGQSDAVQRANLDAAKRLGLVEASSGVMQRILSRLDFNPLLNETVSLVRDTFIEIEEVQLWLVNKDLHNAELAATTSATSPLNEQIGVGSLGAIGRVTISGESIIIRDSPDEQSYRRTALPPGIRSALVLPLKVASEVIGAMEVQSRQLNAFTKDDVEVLQTLANQIAIAIDNARLYAKTQESLAENKRLYEQTRSSLREIERLNQQLTGQAWGDYLRGRTYTPALTLDLQTGQVDSFADWTPTLAEASRTQQIVTRTNAQNKVIALPISVRGQVIGAMEFEVDTDQMMSTEQLAIIQQVIERMGLSADNARLFEEAQRIAHREALVNNISARMQSATSVDAVLSAATQSLAEAFQSPRVAIRLKTGTQANEGVE